MRKKVLIAGGSGLVGSRLSALLNQQGYEVRWLSRNPKNDTPYQQYKWDVKNQIVDENAFDGVSYLINLAGAGIADKPWTESRKQIIIDSRVGSNALLQKYVGQLNVPLKAYVASAAIGYYGDRGEEVMTEDSSPGQYGFLSESCIAWEKAIDDWKTTGIRTIKWRIGLVLDLNGGALPKMALPAHFFLGVYFGDGQQWYSWVHIDDLCGMIIWGMENQNVEGTFNAVAPNPVRNRSMTHAILKTLRGNGLLLPFPVWLLRLIFGEMGDTILSNTKVSAEKIQGQGYQFQYPEINQALRKLYRRNE